MGYATHKKDVKEDGDDVKVSEVPNKKNQGTQPEEDTAQIDGEHLNGVFQLPAITDFHISVGSALLVEHVILHDILANDQDTERSSNSLSKIPSSWEMKTAEQNGVYYIITLLL